MDEHNLENNDESFMNENTSLLKDMKDQSFDNEVSISGQFPFPQETVEMDEESVDFLGKVRSNFMNIKIQNKMNKSVYIPNQRQVKFMVHNSNSSLHKEKGVSNQYCNNTSMNSNYNQSISNNNHQIQESTFFNNTPIHAACSTSFNTFLGGNSASNNNLNNFNLSSEYKDLKKDLSETTNISMNNSGTKRGRKKILFDGVKTEIIDKAILREFKLYVKKSNSLKIIYDELKQEEKEFWNEFMNNSAPPFVFTINGRIQKFKSYNKNLMRYIFSHNSIKSLYSNFLKEKDNDIGLKVLQKKCNSTQVIDKKKRIYYSLYAKNMHKFYSVDEDLDIEELESYFGELSRTSISGTNSNNMNSAQTFSHYNSSTTNNSSKEMNHSGIFYTSQSKFPNKKVSSGKNIFISIRDESVSKG